MESSDRIKKDVSWCPNGTYLLAGATGIRVWDTNTWSKVQTVAEEYFVSSFSWEKDGSRLLAGVSETHGGDEGLVMVLEWGVCEDAKGADHTQRNFIPGYGALTFIASTAVWVMVLRRKGGCCMGM